MGQGHVFLLDPATSAPWSMLRLTLPGRRPVAQQGSTRSSWAFCGISLYMVPTPTSKCGGAEASGSVRRETIWISPCFRSFYLVTRIFVTFAAGLQLSKIAARQEAMELHVRGPAPASPKIRPCGVTLVVFSMRHFVGLFTKGGRLLPTRSLHRPERSRSFRASAQTWTTLSLRAIAPDVVRERADALSPRTREKVSVP